MLSSVGGCGCDCGSHSADTPGDNETEKVQLQVYLQQPHTAGSRGGSIRTTTRVVHVTSVTADGEESTDDDDQEEDPMAAVIINSVTNGAGGPPPDDDDDDDGSQNATLI